MPPSMVEAAIEQIWAQLEQDCSRRRRCSCEKRMEAERESIAISLSAAFALSPPFGNRSSQWRRSQLAGNDMLVQQAAQHYRPEDRQRFVQYLSGKPNGTAQLRAPLFEARLSTSCSTRRPLPKRRCKDVLEARLKPNRSSAPRKEGASKKAGCQS